MIERPLGPRPPPRYGLPVLVRRTVWWYFYQRGYGLVLLRIARLEVSHRSANTYFFRAHEVIYGATAPRGRWRPAFPAARQSWRIRRWLPQAGRVVGIVVLV